MFIRALTTFMVICLMAPMMACAANDQHIVNQFIGTDDPPTIPENVIATPISQTAITVTWDPATDDTGLAGYEVFRNGTLLATVTAPTTGYSDTLLQSSTTYSYQVRAYDIGLLYSAFSTTSATTTYASTATSTPQEEQHGGGGTQMKPLSLSISAFAESDAIVLAMESSLKVKATIRWGTTGDASLGSLTLPTFEETHRTQLTGLRPGTTYTVVVTIEDEYGRILFKSLKVTTTTGKDTEAPANPSLFTGISTTEGVVLTWKNPQESDFREVRIMRLPGTVPVDPYDGVMVYEGPQEQFIDRSGTEGAVYGYTIFAKDQSGNYSSGAVTFVRTWSEGSIGDVQFPVDENAEATTTLTVGMIITQGDIAQHIEDDTFTITTGAPFLIRVPADVFPRVLKTILVTLRHPDGTGRSFTFLLRANKERTAYEARIDALDTEGEYRATISFLNLASHIVLKNDFIVKVIEGMDIPMQRTSSPIVRTTGIVILLSILISLLTLMARRMWRLGKAAAAPTALH